MTGPSLSPADTRVASAPTVRVYDPAMCCSTGVCGPDVDADLIRFAADLDWLEGEGVVVERFNLAQQPAAFASDRLARRFLQDVGEAGLPLILVDGVAKSSGTYPSPDLLADWAQRPRVRTRPARHPSRGHARPRGGTAPEGPGAGRDPSVRLGGEAVPDGA